ncbi:MAG: VanZ family protein [Propionibacteriaceae bacterium]|nr:VanZ family protein [Propionibacteriaceae bacterium]
MIQQALQSALVGLGVAVVCFVPYLVYQYRRYGQFSASRMVWMIALLVYGTALVTYTLFPLPSQAWCAVPHPGMLELDPSLYFRDMWQMHAAGTSWMGVATSWTMMQMALNVLLFVPLGFIVRHLWKVGVARATLLGLGISLLIELTQLTGNWFTAPCAYRVADISDVWTNTLGAFLGAVLALLTPRLAADADALESMRADARPVTRGRRWAGMLIDAVAVGVVWAGVSVVMAVGYYVIAGDTSADREAAAAFSHVITAVAVVCCFAVVVVFALVGSGASLGQRLVYLQPVSTRPRPRFWLLVRALVVQGVALALVLGTSSLSLFGVAWLGLAVIWVAFQPRGLSFALTGCQIVDARSQG